MQNDFLEKFKNKLCDYRNIPKELSNYIVDVIKEDKETEILSPILKDDTQRKKVWEKIDYQIKKGSNITKLSILELLKALDFHPKDIRFCRFDAMFAELRTIFFLTDLNLYDINPLKAKNKKNKKSADFIAKGNSHKYAIEVFCKVSKEEEDIIEISRKMSKEELEKLSRKFKPAIKPSTNRYKLFRHYMRKAEEKKQQLVQTAKKYSCDKNIMAMVLNDLNILPKLVYCEYNEILKDISIKLNWGSDYHFAIITGVLDLLNGSIDNFVYPPI